MCSVLFGAQEQCKVCSKWTVRNKDHLCKQCNHNRRYTVSAATPPSAAAPRMRSKRPYEEIGPTQRWERRKRARTALEQIGVPAAALLEHRPFSVAALELSIADRRKIRKVNDLHIAGEKRIAESKKALAHTHGTLTAAFSFPRAGTKGSIAVGAHVCDPLLLLRTVASESPFLSVGGDKGGGFTKLGVTYTAQSTQHFLPLLVFEGDDHYEDLHALRTSHLTTFSGQSADHTHIFSVLQHIINTYHAFLNGDWPFISCMLQHKGHAANYPCPICIVPKEKLLSAAAYRRPVDGNSLHPINDAFLSIPPERIVPTPLHLYLGISNRIIFEAFKKLVGKEQLERIFSTVKTVHSAGCGGLSDLYQLNGPEISRWMRRGRAQEVAIIASAVVHASAGVEVKVEKMSEWMQKLEHYLLKRSIWDPVELFRFRALLDDIYAHWRKTTGDGVFPKLHMLRHAVEFAERYQILGAASEAQIESFHFRFNTLYHQQHRNMSHQPFERIRRCLADSVVALAAPVAADEIASAATALLHLQAPAKPTRQTILILRTA